MEQKEENKKKIAEKSLEAFKDHGYHGTSMNIISSYTGLSKGGVYAYFYSKEDLFIFILEYILNQKPYYLSQVNHEQSAYSQLLEQWKSIIFSWEKLDYVSTKLTFEFWLESSKKPEYREKLLESYSVTEQYFTDIIDLGKRNNEFDPQVDSNTMAQIFWSYVDGQVQFWVARNYQPTLGELNRLYNQLKLLVKGMRAHD
ncbi:MULTISPECIES: TetR/AcrR family transcriptional regulator [Pontibacillus]|uniref:TetR/AcrR family transcriptional regulator n=1 Tax=Pontibacillus chungwhensis TaxID=265426 RepID=A0ABY8UVF5_9BACI|nr:MULTISPECIES: TetR/AcrR family transcriptional regulator [Pontibacillus]WIF96736.1 TetR/AcrR family transcriptional regulator [Pontibacillus chungwhensis]